MMAPVKRRFIVAAKPDKVLWRPLPRVSSLCIIAVIHATQVPVE